MTLLKVAAVPGALHIAAQTSMGATFTTIDHGVEPVFDDRMLKAHTGNGRAFSLEFAVLLPDGERLTLTLADPASPSRFGGPPAVTFG